MKKKITKFGLGAICLLIIVTFVCNWTIVNASKNFIYSEVNKIPTKKVGVLLETSKLLKSGNPNLYFSYRIDAAVKLFQSGKIEFIIVSGDNSNEFYNEPLDMKNALVEKGIPEDKIILDYAGFRTLDSIIRAKEVFGQTTFTIISQKFHNERAIYLAKRNGIDAIGFNAKEVVQYGGFLTKVRETFARNKVFIDLLLNKAPKYLGEKIVIE